MSCLSLLNGSLATLLVWLPPSTADAPWLCIKTAKFEFRWHIRLWIGQISLPWNSPELFFGIFSVPEGECQGVWPFYSCHMKWKVGWNWEIPISLVLGHLDWHICDGHFFSWKIQKTHFFNNKHMIKWARNLLDINIFTRATHLSHPQTLAGKKRNFSFFSEIRLSWIGSMKTPQNGQKWPPKPH